MSAPFCPYSESATVKMVHQCLAAFSADTGAGAHRAAVEVSAAVFHLFGPIFNAHSMDKMTGL